MKKPRVIVSCACVVLLLSGAGCSTLSVVRNPKVAIPVEHPAGIGIRLTRVTFAPPSGSCSAHLANAATQELLARGVEVGSDLTVVGSGAGGSVPAEAPGGHILLSLSDTACEGERSTSTRRATKTRKKTFVVAGKKKKYKEKYTVIHYTRTTRFEAGISLRASDPRTRRVVAAWEMRHPAAASNTDVDDVPEYPSETVLRRTALGKAGVDLVRWLLPWTEEVRLLFYDAEECGMGATYAHFAAGDLDAALEAARRSIEACERTRKEARFRAAAYYNAGLLHFFKRRYTAAHEMFETAAAIDPENRQVSRASREAGKARKLLEEIRKIDAQAGDPPNG